jgi:tyrosyl-tRNA synthetase
MSKSYNNYISLTDEPNEMFGKCMRIPDQLIIKYMELTTSFTGSEIDKIKANLEGGGNPKDAKELLAKQLVIQYHGDQEGNAALDHWHKVHSQKQVPDDMPSHVVSQANQLFRIVVETGLAAGSGEAKRLIQEGGVRLDNEQIKDPNHSISLNPGEHKILQAGRRKFVRLVSQ